MVGWSAGCGESYLSGAGSAERNSTAERQHGRRPSTPSLLSVCVLMLPAVVVWFLWAYALGKTPRKAAVSAHAAGSDCPECR